METSLSACDQMRKIFSEKLQIDPPGEEADLIDAGVLDSFMFVELLYHVEQQFGVKITLENLDIDNFRSINRIVDMVAAANG